MEFKTDIFSLLQSPNKTINLIGAKLPNSKDVYFRAKQKEIVDQYAGARIFMHETENDDWSHWFNQSGDEVSQQRAESLFKSYFYESALTFYNIVVDLSWTLCYLAVEFSLTQRGERVDFGGCMPIEEAYKLMRQAENNVTSPTAEESPFTYLKRMSPEYVTAIDMIIDFWLDFSGSTIRQRYNFCKHKGKPLYTEIDALQGSRLMNMYIQMDDGSNIQLPSDIRDVQMPCSLSESIEELRRFDDEKLFPYISALFAEIEQVVNPSPFI